MTQPKVHRKQLAKEQRRAQQRRAARRRRLLRALPIVALVGALVGGGGIWAVTALQNVKVYPPTTVFPNHPEVFPPRRVMTEPIDDAIQSHVMEHGSSQPGAPPGVIVSYNCVTFACEPDLVEKLRQAIERRSTGVYLAPYPRMDAKIALATQGKLEVLDAFDEEQIARFIDASGNR